MLVQELSCHCLAAAGAAEVQSSVGTLLEGLLEGLTGDEPEDEGGLGGEGAFEVGG